MKILTIASDLNHYGLKRFIRSLDKYGWQYEILQRPFRFGGQMEHIAEWCKGKNEPFIYCDAYDTICFGSENEIKNEIKNQALFSAEKNCYPIVQLAKEYPETTSVWKYVNGGGFMITTDLFTEIYKTHKPDDNDQDWLARQYLANQDKIWLDRNCEVFQTIAFSNISEWQRSFDRFQNIGTGTFPLFFHGNGHTDMKWLEI